MSGGRVTIPNNVRKMIQNIKEITGNHSEDEIYAMLKECSMDPNETAQKLLLQDPFHEVKRKRDRKKENLTKEPIEPRWKPGMQGRGNRGNRGNYSSRHISNDAGGGRTTLSAKENGIIKQGAEEGAKLSIAQGQKSKEMSVETDKKHPEVTLSTSSSKLEGPLPKVPPFEASKIPTAALHGSSKNMEAYKTPSPSPGVYLSEKDPILMPSQDSRLPVGTIRREVGSQRTIVDQSQETPLEIKSTASASEVGSSSMQGKAPSSHVPFSIARPSSNYNNRLQQAIGPQKVGPSMEWKPKPTNPILGQGTGSNEGGPTEPPNPNLESKDANHELEKKLKDSHISDDEHVIIPNHLHVPEAEKLGFCFGSFDASFGLHSKTSSNGPDPVSDKTSSQVDERIIEAHSRSESALPTPDGEDNPERPTSSENLETEGDMSSNAGPKQDSSSLPTPAHQHPPVHTSPNFSFGFMPPPMIGTQQLASFENNDPQARDGSQVPSFVVEQAFDPASYYGQFYRESDGRIGIPTKYNPAPTLSSPPSQSSQSQEVGKSVMVSRSTSPASAAATGVSEEVLRQPHYPPNYIPYAPYFSPFYVPPPPAFLSNATFPLPAAKYPVTQHQYKPAAGHIGMPYANEDLAASHFKQTNLYITGHQSEGPGVWIAGPGRDMSGLQASSFYNLPQVPYTPNHASFAPNIYHHPPQPQPVTTPLPGPTGDMVGPTPTGYHQQPQPTQINWPNNY